MLKKINIVVSVIIPIYNVEEFLPRCLDSVCGQTFSDLEIILVDDGSTDGSGQICDTYAQSDSRIRVVHKENGGLSEARNTGLDEATGDYVCMPDDDDVLHPQMIEILHNLITSGDYDFSMCMGCWVYDASEIPLKVAETFTDIPSNAYQQDELIKIWGMDLIQCRYQYSVAWNKLFRRSSLGNLRYIKTTEEDVEFSSRYVQRAQKAIVTDLSLYYYICRAGSLSRPQGVGQAVRPTHIPETTMESLANFPIESKAYRALVLQRLYLQMPIFLNGVRSYPSIYRETKDKYKAFRKLTMKEYRSNPYIPMRKKMKQCAFVYSPFLYRIYLLSKKFRQN